MKSLSSAVYGCVFTTRYVCFAYINYSKISFFSLGHVLCLFCLHRNPRSLYLSGSEILTAVLTALTNLLVAFLFGNVGSMTAHVILREN